MPKLVGAAFAATLMPAAVALAATLASPPPAAAQSGAPFEIRKYTIDSGGGISASGPVAVQGTLGQPDANATVSAGAYRIRGGFWAAPAEPLPDDILLRDSFE